jgi:arylsulfatase A-like enzyme
MQVQKDLKVVLVLWDGVRYDAIFKVNKWMGLPNLFKLMNNGVLYSNVYTQQPVLTPTAVGRIMKDKNGKWISMSLHEKTNGQIKSAFAGYPEEGIRRVPEWIPHCKFLDITYNRREEWRRLFGTPAEKASMKFHRVQLSDKVRMDAACKLIPHYNFNFVYFVQPDTNAHECRDRKKHIYHYGSPYVHAIKQCDNLLYHIIKTLEWCAKNRYIVIVVADHGMTDEGRHSIAQWNDNRVMHVPLIISGRGIRKNWIEREVRYTHDITSGIVGLFTNTTNNTIFQWAMQKNARR